MKGPGNPEPAVEIRNVTTRFGRSTVHDDVSLTIRRGEVFALAGGSGSGKTTLLREMLLLQKPSSGSIRLLGRDLAGLDEAGAESLHRRCGVLFQRGALFTAMTVEENVAAPLVEFTDLSKRLIRELAALKIALAGLPADSASKYPNELSGGMRKRAAMARAIANDPEILFLDEPSAGLDPVSASGLDELILRLKDLLGLTVVMVTHDLDSLWRVADRVAVLGEGKILGSGTMEELCRSADPVIRQYFHGPRGRAAREQSWNRK
jgi:phospholipid/cholesterol/gamma-HCH transport system ATP-binding protein